MAKTIFILIICTFCTAVTHTMENESFEEQLAEIREEMYQKAYFQKKERDEKKAKEALMDAHRTCINGRWHVLVDPDWKNTLPVGAPATLCLLHEDEPITDELLKRLNPEWVTFHAQLSRDEIRYLFNAACTYPSITILDSLYFVSSEGRTLFALVRALSSDLIEYYHLCHNADGSIGDLINAAMDQQDHHFLEFLLTKCNMLYHVPNFIKYKSLEWCRTIQLARILLRHGAIIHKATLEAVAQKDYPAELIEFYLNQKPDLERYTSDGYNILFTLTIYWAADDYYEHKWSKYFENRMKIINVLLNSGFDLSMKYKDCTPFRRESTPLHSAVTRNNKLFCKIVVKHYLERQDTFTKLFIQFLCCIKNQFYSFYRSKDICKYIFDLLSPSAMHQLQKILLIKDQNGRTPYQLYLDINHGYLDTLNSEGYDICSVQRSIEEGTYHGSLELLNPATCTYKQKLLEYRLCRLTD